MPSGFDSKKTPRLGSSPELLSKNVEYSTKTKTNDVAAEAVKAAYNHYCNMGSSVKRQVIVEAIVALEKNIEQLDVSNPSHKSLLEEIKKKEINRTTLERPVISDSSDRTLNASIHNYIIILAKETLPPELNISKHNKSLEKQEIASISQRNIDALSTLRSRPEYIASVEKHEQNKIKTQSSYSPTISEDQKKLTETLKTLSGKIGKFIAGTNSALEKTKQSFVEKEIAHKQQSKTTQQQK